MPIREPSDPLALRSACVHGHPLTPGELGTESGLRSSSTYRVEYPCSLQQRRGPGCRHNSKRHGQTGESSQVLFGHPLNRTHDLVLGNASQ